MPASQHRGLKRQSATITTIRSWSCCRPGLRYTGMNFDPYDFAQLYTAAWCNQDAARVAACYSPDGSLTINNGPPSVGRAAITAAAQSFMTDFPDLKVIMD